MTHSTRTPAELLATRNAVIAECTARYNLSALHPNDRSRIYRWRAEALRLLNAGAGWHGKVGSDGQYTATARPLPHPDDYNDVRVLEGYWREVVQKLRHPV